MPFEVVKVGSGYKVKNTDTEKFYSDKPQSKEEATAQMKAMISNMGQKLLKEKKS